jgi:hypothetical protein
MLERRTVFILGAGASAPYGFPIGSDLAGEIVRGLALGSRLRDMLRRAEFREGDLDDFRERLRLAGGTSIDFFLEDQPEEVVAIGKAAIALQIRNAEHNCREKEWLVTPPTAPTEAPDHWLNYAWELMRPGCTPQNLAHKANVCFVTFNYDRTVEQFFDRVLASNFNLRPEEAVKLRADAIEIIHLHGAIPDAFPFGSYGPDSALRAREASQGLLLINDKVEPDPQRWTKARAKLQEAALVLVVGFGFHRLNTERLQLDRVPETIPIVGGVYRMASAEIRQARRWIKRGWIEGKSGLKAEAFLREHADLF